MIIIIVIMKSYTRIKRVGIRRIFVSVHIRTVGQFVSV